MHWRHKMEKSSLSLLTLLALTACDPVTPEIGTGFDLQRFSSCDAMNDHLTDSFVRNMSSLSGGMLSEDSAVLPEAGSSGENSPSDYSTTNVQEANVDEPDMVKTDGNYVYVLENGTLSIVKSWPAEQAEVVGQVDIGVHSEKMFLFEDRIALYSSDWTMDEGGYGRTQTIVQLIDITNRSEPSVISKKALDGDFISARMIDSDVYTVLSNRVELPAEVYEDVWDVWYDEEGYWDWRAPIANQLLFKSRLERQLRPLIADAMRDRPSSEILPSVTHEDGTREPLVSCTDVLHGSDISEPQITTVVHMDMDSGDIKMSGEATSVMAGSTTVYASSNNLYVAQSSNAWWDGISEIERVTNIHRFSLNGANTDYAGSGQVDGYMHNQFSMSEYKGMLRVSTTYSDWWWGTSTDDNRSGNNVFVLDIEQSQMSQIGAITGLAPGEQIYATRFQGERAFMVTFVQVDPLFTIDLSQPTAPVAKGELKIPGYSSYLHPIGDDHILGVGVDGDWDGRISGVAVSLFDVSDFSDPQQQDKLTMECDSTWSEALWDHHAILVHNDTVALPVYGWSWDTDSEYTSGLLVASINTNSGLTQTGFVDHSPLVEAVYCPDEKDCTESFVPQMRRSLMIEDYLFSISDLGIMVSPMDDPEATIAEVPLF